MGDDKQESTGRENRRAKVIQPNSDGLSEEQKRQFYLLTDEYEGMFAMKNSDLGKSDLMDYQITLVRMLRLSRFLVAYHRTRGRS